MWASHLIGWLFVALVAGIEGWADGQEEQAQRRAAAALRRQQEVLHQQQREEEERAAELQRQALAQAEQQERRQQLQPTMSAGSSSKLGGSQVGLDSPLLSASSEFERSWQRLLLDLDGPATPLAPALPRGAADSAAAAATAVAALAAPAGAAAAAPGAALAAGQRAQSADLTQRAESENLLPPVLAAFAGGIPASPSKPGPTGAAAGKGQATGYPVGPEGASGSAAGGADSGGGICRFILSLDASYLAEHVQASMRATAPCACYSCQQLSGVMGIQLPALRR